ncbi:Amino acid transporter AVT6C [Citrus sinensis]|uniref:Amino acid transporter AVT6C n=1 Tax=Citrus sinensis TaxID=2711 RepID=A0ACB8L270_CITSI|nr:Amino acid transporter AVT6C [Citrus sinensis]
MSPAPGLQAPLLPNSKTEKRPWVSGAVFNVATSIIGAGIMSIAATVKVLGVIPAFVLIVIIAWLTDVSVEILMRYTHAGETSTYAGVMRESFGRAGSVAAQLCVMITNLGCLIIFFIIIARRISSFGCFTRMVRLSLVEYASYRSAIRYGVCDASISLIRACCSAISVLLAVMFVAICSVMAIYAVGEGKSKSPKLLPQLDNHVSLFDLFPAVPVIVTAFTFYFNGFELDKPSDMITAFLGSTSAVCLAFIFPGVIVLRDVHGISTTGDRIIATVMMVLAVVTSTIAISTNIYGSISNKS